VFVSLLAAGALRIVLVERALLVLVAGSLIYALVYQYVLQSSFSHWYLANLYVSHAILLAAGLRALLGLPGWIEQRAKGRSNARTTRLLEWGARGVAVAALLAFVAQAAPRLQRFDLHPPRRVIYSDLGRWLERNTAPEASVAYFEIGYLGWHSRRTIIDLVGLVTPGGVEAVQRGDLYWAFETYEPDYFVFYTKQRRAAFMSSAWFRTHYTPIQRFSEPGFPGELRLYRKMGSGL
jgi:hypothetical protein